jgi:hypothetical protein
LQWLRPCGGKLYKVGELFSCFVSFSVFTSPPLSHCFESFVCSMKSLSILASLAAVLPTASACGASGHSDSCYGPINHVEHVRHVKRMQPGASGASYGPSRPLEWGQLNIMHTVCCPLACLYL